MSSGNFRPRPARLLDDVRKIHGGAGFLQRMRDHVAGLVDVKIFRAPALDVVKRARRIDVPRRRRCVSRTVHQDDSDLCIIKSCAQKSTNTLKNICDFPPPGQRSTAHLFDPTPRKSPRSPTHFRSSSFDPLPGRLLKYWEHAASETRLGRGHAAYRVLREINNCVGRAASPGAGLQVAPNRGF